MLVLWPNTSKYYWWWIKLNLFSAIVTYLVGAFICPFHPFINNCDDFSWCYSEERRKPSNPFMEHMIFSWRDGSNIWRGSCLQYSWKSSVGYIYSRSILNGCFNPLVFWYQWEYLLTSKDFFFAGYLRLVMYYRNVRQKLMFNDVHTFHRSSETSLSFSPPSKEHAWCVCAGHPRSLLWRELLWPW